MDRPAWLDTREYPFTSHWLDVDGGRMHYIDEGQGPVLLMLHGTPDWSFLFRNLVKAFAPRYRCIAPDHLGFGLSDKPRDWDYRPRRHAANVRRLIEHRQLRDLTLVLHDFGGPYGLPYALEEPENVRALVLMNTWMWSLRGDPHFEQFARLLGGRLGRFLYLQLNFSARFIMPMSFGNRKLPAHLHRQYTAALPTPGDRLGTWGCARALLGESEWFDSLWQRRARLEHKPALILWGMKDTAFRPQELARLESALPQARTVRLEGVGHFVPEEDPARSTAFIQEFLTAP